MKKFFVIIATVLFGNASRGNADFLRIIDSRLR